RFAQVVADSGLGTDTVFFIITVSDSGRISETATLMFSELFPPVPLLFSSTLDSDTLLGAGTAEISTSFSSAAEVDGGDLLSVSSGEAELQDAVGENTMLGGAR